MGVAHGHTVDDYVRCYLSLKDMGFDSVAVGGLLARRDNTVRYPYVRNGTLMLAVLRELRARYPDEWLFALGVLHPRRIGLLQGLETWADYKGWIFQYEKRSVTLTRYLQDLGGPGLDVPAGHANARAIGELQRLFAVRVSMITRLQAKRAGLQASSLGLRQALFDVSARFPAGSAMRAKLVTLSSHALLDPAEERMVRQALRDLSEFDSEYGQEILRLIDQTRTFKQNALLLERRIETAHRLIRTRMELLARSTHQSPSTKAACSRVIECIDRSEQTHRLQQVRSNIAERVLAPLVKAD